MAIENSLMYKSYKVTEYGEIPSEWEMVKISTISDIIDPQPDHRAPKEMENGIPYVGVGDFFRNKQIDYKKTRKVVPEALVKQKTAFTIEDGDIAFGKVGTLGNPRRLPPFSIARQEYALSATMVVIKPKNINSSYLYYFLQSDFFMFQVQKGRTGTTRPSLGIKVIRDFYCLLPSFDEQQKIAEILSAVDEQIEKTDQLIEKTKELKKGLIKHLLEKGIGHKNFKKSEVGEIPLVWKVKTFEEIMVLQRGFDLPVQNRVDGDIPIVSANGISGFHNEVKIKAPGIITGRSGTIGKVNFIERDYWPLNTALYVKETYDNDPKFLYYFLSEFKLERFSTGTGVPTLNRNNVHIVKVAIPKIEEQKKIAEILSAIDKQIEICEKEKEKQTELKKALMQQLLTGKLRVTV